MRVFIISILPFLYSLTAISQNKWVSLNDTCFHQTKRFYGSCNNLTSSKTITTEQINIDRSLIKLLNNIYNNPEYSIKEMKIETACLENRTLYQYQSVNKSVFEFNANAEGNLYVSVKAVLEGDVLKEKSIYIATKTHVLCNNDTLYVNALDFIYLELFNKDINFPIGLKPYQANLDIRATYN